MKRSFILLFAALLLYHMAQAQFQSPAMWVFGYHSGLNFSTSNPAPITSSVATHSAAAGVQTDVGGNILFYANGLKIWNRNGDTMSNGTNPLWPNDNEYITSWNTNAIIVPDVSNPDRYYVFQTFPSKGDPPYGPYFMGQLTYTVVDMSLNGGLGGVVPGMSHVLIDKHTGHFLMVVPGTACNYWVFAMRPSGASYTFRTYELNAAGVNATPVQSYFASLPSNYSTFGGVGCRAGNMIYSHKRDMLFMSYESGDLYAFNFNRTTGKLTAAHNLGWAYTPANVVSFSFPAICFSPNESFLYMSGYTAGSSFQLRQYPVIDAGGSVSLGTPELISDAPDPTLTMVEQSTGYVWNQSAMQRGLDGMIYHAYTLGQSFLGRIEQPDQPGLACQFVPKAVFLQPGTYTTSSLPGPAIPRNILQPIAGTRMDTSLCFQPSLVLRAPDSSYSFYTWQNGSHSRWDTATVSGRYTVLSSNDGCSVRTDTFDVRLTNFSLSLGNDTLSCLPLTLQPLTNALPPVAYAWQDGSPADHFATDAPGRYWLSLTKDGCTTSDTIHISREPLSLSFPSVTPLCTGSSLRLDATVAGGTAYRWQDGSTAPWYDVTAEGRYEVSVTKGYCEAHAATTVDVSYCGNCLLAVPTAFSPNHDGRNDMFLPLTAPLCSIQEYDFSIYNRYGERVFYTNQPDEGWDGTFRSMLADVGTYMYLLHFRGDNGKSYDAHGDIALIR